MMAASLRCSRANGFPPLSRFDKILEAGRQSGKEQETLNRRTKLGFLGFGRRYVENCHPVLSFIHSGTPKSAGEDKRENLC
jgi:hypothetical protein